jgi:hypothetical protein
MAPDLANSPSSSDRARECMESARSLLVDSNGGLDARVLKEAINFAREALMLSSAVDNDMIYACSMLAHALQQIYELDNSLSYVVEAVHLSRKALSMAHEGHPARADCCGILGNSLKMHYEAVGDDYLLAEAIDVERHALVLRSAEDPHRAGACGNLASSLKLRYKYTSDDALLTEATDLEREALALRREHDPDRAGSCVNLAASLMDRYEHTNEDRLLSEAISLQREALILWGEGHPYRTVLYANLAMSLRMRYEHIGDDDLIMNAIELQREVLALRPVGNPRRAAACASLAQSLSKRFERHKEDHLIIEAIDLEREAIALCHERDPHLLIYYGNLASSLIQRHYKTDDIAFLTEAIGLLRKTLALCPEDHLKYAGFCGNLTASLKLLYDSSSDQSLLDEILIFGQVAVVNGSPHTVWRFLCTLAWVHLQIDSCFYDVSKTISYLSRCLENELDDIPRAVYAILVILDGVWCRLAENKHMELLIVYRRLVDFLPLIAHPALKPKLQLRSLKVCSQVGSDAFVNAALAGTWTSAFDTLELAQGVIWSQGLHLRDPQLQAVPEPLGQEIERLLFAIAEQSPDRLYDERPSALTPLDMLHDRSSKVYTLIRQIRALPGLDHFMLGETFEALCSAASNHPVVVLVGARGHYYALILASSQPQGHLLPLDLNDEDAGNLSLAHITLQQQRGGPIPDGTRPAGQKRALVISAPQQSRPWNRLLKALWLKVVRPVIDHLGLEASIRGGHSNQSRLTV